LGLAAALLLGRLARSLLYGLAPTDPAIPVMAVAVLGAIAAAAGYLPPRRASRGDPVVAPRGEEPNACTHALTRDREMLSKPFTGVRRSPQSAGGVGRRASCCLAHQ